MKSLAGTNIKQNVGRNNYSLAMFLDVLFCQAYFIAFREVSKLIDLQSILRQSLAAVLRLRRG